MTRILGWAPLLAVLAAVPCAGAVPADSTGAAPEPPPAASGAPAGLPSHGGVAFALVTAAALIATVPQDAWLTSESDESQSPGRSDVARAAQPLGNGAIVLSALFAGWAVSRLAGRPDVSSAFGRIAISVGAAGACALIVKQVAGRPRPVESPGDSDNLMLFSGHSSFPSGHATVAFALATAINVEAPSRWTPWVTYPAAALVGWSRVYGHEHWASDVVAGAALGIWTAHRVEMRLHRSARGDVAIVLEPETLGGRPGLALALERR